MKLFAYEHCPYCVRPRLVADINKLDYELVILENDDEKSHYDLVGKKIVPILEKNDGVCMTESLDICQYLDQEKGKYVFKPVLDENNIISNIEQLYAVAKKLTYPRMVYHPMNKEDFPTLAAVNYFKTKKEKSLGVTFKQAIQDSAKYQTEVQNALNDLNNQFVYQYIASDSLSQHDIIAFAYLRTLMLANDVLNMPSRIGHYLSRVSSQTNIKLYDVYDFSKV